MRKRSNKSFEEYSRASKYRFLKYIGESAVNDTEGVESETETENYERSSTSSSDEENYAIPISHNVKG